jgi:predicted RNA-binding protein with RPS1 domain
VYVVHEIGAVSLHEIDEAERKEADWDRFYESKRKEMEDFQAMSQQFEAEARKEVQRLKDLVSQVRSRPLLCIDKRV